MKLTSSAFIGSKFEAGFCVARTRVESVDGCLIFQLVGKSQVNVSAFGHAQKSSGDLRRASHLTEGLNGKLRTIVSFQVPPSAAQFEVNSEYAILQLSSWLAVLVGYDLIGSQGLCNRDCWQNANQQEATKSS
jgi:hypothetical protein